MRYLWLVGLCVFVAGMANAQTLPPGFTRQVVASSITSPTVMAFAPDGRIFVGQQAGTLRVVKNGSLQPTPFTTLPSISSSGERGLIGVALDPDFSSNGHVYVYHTMPSVSGNPPFNRITRFTANGDVALTGSDTVILNLDNLSGATNHNGGAMAFGPDGKLYVAVGDNANTSTPQNLDTYHGKMLRLNKNGSAPTDNPFFTGTASEQRKRVWSYGLRNPYTIAFQPGTGRLFVNEVGQNAWEEINEATAAGRNFGWPATEGPTSNPNFTAPWYAYAHTGAAPTGCAITGGTFFNPPTTNYPATYLGKYFFQDYCSAWIYYIDPAQSNPVPQLFASSVGGQSLSITAGTDGNLYYLSRTAATLYRLAFASGSGAPVITQPPASTTVTVNQPATFTVTATGDAPLRYQWNRHGVPIAGANQSTLSFPSTQFSQAGTYTVIVSNNAGSVTSTEVSLTVTGPNQPPVASITQPLASFVYRAGTQVDFAGSGTDAEDGTLPASSFQWEINFHHDDHFHDQPPIVGIKSGTFEIPNQGETSANVWYRFMLTVTDSQGLTGKDTVDIYPRKSTLTLQTDPPGLMLTLDGQPIATPHSVQSVVGMLRSIGASDTVVQDNREFTFDGWQHGGAIIQAIATPEQDATYTARYSLVVSVTEPPAAIYPQPANHFFILNEPQATELQLTDITGHALAPPIQRQGGALTVDTRLLAPGVYILRYQIQGKPQQAKVIIRK